MTTESPKTPETPAEPWKAGPEYWDAPHVLPDPRMDPFLIFLCNSQALERMRDCGWQEEQVDQAKQIYARNLAQHRERLVEVLNNIPMGERHRWREYAPELEWWSNWATLTRRRIHPAWPWDLHHVRDDD
jgi:hypothetical protein